jgi:hypothetical protein
MGAATVLEIEAATPPIRKLVAQSAELCVVIAWALCVGVWMCQYEVVTMYSGSLGSHAVKCTAGFMPSSDRPSPTGIMSPGVPCRDFPSSETPSGRLIGALVGDNCRVWYTTTAVWYSALRSLVHVQASGFDEYARKKSYCEATIPEWQARAFDL